MKIAVNLFLTSPKSITGAFVYIQNILPVLFEANKENTYYLLGEPNTIKYFKSLYKNTPNVKFNVFNIRRDIFVNPVRAVKKLVAKVNHDYRTYEDILSNEVNTILTKENVDLYFSPASTVFPRGLNDNIKKVTAIMDIQHEYIPENFSSSYLEKRRETFSYAVENSDHIIAISEYTKKTILEQYPNAIEKISVVYFAPQEIKNGPINFNIPKEFVFYPAALWSHKNHRVLIQALGILKERFPSLNAVCAGLVKNRALQHELEIMVESEGLNGRVHFPGLLFNGDLRTLYTQAKALVFPSSFEGFGIPLVEAFQFGLPVIAANNTSITEVVDDAGILIRTGDEKALADAIEKVITNDKLRRELIKMGHERVKLFSWKKAARETLAVFSRA